MSAGRAEGVCSLARPIAQRPVAPLAQNSRQMTRGSPVFLLHHVTFTLNTTDHYGDLSYIIQKSLCNLRRLYHHSRTPFVFCKGKCPLVLQSTGNFLVHGLPGLTESNSSNIHCLINTEIPSSMHQSLPHLYIPEQTGA